MRRLGVVDLETSGQRALSERVWVVTQKGVVVAQEGVVDGVIGVSQKQILVLLYYLIGEEEEEKMTDGI